MARPGPALPVTPTEADQEEPYIERNIEATRAAYDIEDAEIQSYNLGVRPARLRARAGRDRRPRHPPRRPLGGARDLRAAPAGARLLHRARGPRRRPLPVQRHRARQWCSACASSTRRASARAPRTGPTSTPSTPHGYGMIAAFGNQRDASNDEQVTADDTDEGTIEEGRGGERAPRRPATGSRSPRSTSRRAARADRPEPRRLRGPDLLRRELAAELHRRQRRPRLRGRRARPARRHRGLRRLRRDDDLPTRRRRRGRRAVQQDPVRREVRRAQHRALGPRQRELQDPLRPRPRGPGREGRPVAHGRLRPVPRVVDGPCSGSSTATRSPTATRRRRRSRSRR